MQKNRYPFFLLDEYHKNDYTFAKIEYNYIFFMCVILAVKILCGHHGTTEATKKIKAGLVKAVRQLIPVQKDLTALEKEQLGNLLVELDKTESELAEELRKLL